MITRHGFPSADLRQVFLGRRHRPAESVLHLSFKSSRHQSAWSGVQVHPQRIQVCRDAACGNAAVETGDRTNLWIGKRRRNYLEVIGIHTHIAIAHHHQVVFRFLHQAAQAVHFAVRANSLRALN